MPQGGARVGAGRTPLAPSRKKKDYKIYLNTDVYEDINTAPVRRHGSASPY